MAAVEEEDLYIIIPRKYADQLCMTHRGQLKVILNRIQTLRREEGHEGPAPRYYLCRQDEPYAETVRDTILRNEELKQRGRWE